jgi:uncharacterized protein YcnI
MRRLISLVFVAALLPATALAHAVVEPARSTPRAYQRYLLRVPNELDVATTRVEIRVPADVRVISFVDVPGWQLEVSRDSANRITAAVWIGSLPPGRFIEFPFMAVNPERETRLVWPVDQTYATGERIEWAGPEDSDRPASATQIQADEPVSTSRLPLLVAGGAVLLSLVSLAVALRRRSADQPSRV